MSSDSDRITPYVWRISAVVMAGALMSILDTTVVNVALETLSRELDSTIADIQWVATSYMLALATVIPVSGWAANRFGPKRVYLISLLMFTIGSMLCGLAQSTNELIAFRVLQGFGGGMIMPLGQMMMADAAGPKRMGRVMSISAIPLMLAPVFGPVLGAVLVESFSWRWIFYINVPIGIIAAISAIRILPNPAGAKDQRLDALGLTYMGLGVPALTYSFAEVGVSGDFGSLRFILPFIAGVVLIGMFIPHALRTKYPLLDIRLYKRKTFASASFTLFSVSAAMFGSMVLLPLYWQGVRGESVIHTGLLTAPQGIGLAIAMPIAGKLADRFGGGPLVLGGVIVTALATIPFALVTDQTPVASLAVSMLVRGFGIGFAMMPAMAAAFSALQRSELTHATPQLNVLQRIGGSMGTAVLAVVVQSGLSGARTSADAAAAYGTGFWVATGLVAAAIIPSVALLRAEREARAQRPPDPAEQHEAALEAVAV